MGRFFAIIAFSTLILFLSSNLFSQCTDSDNDGYYYEEGCGIERDCNDANPDIYPGASEICNGYDDNCDGSLDEGCDTSCDDPKKLGSEIRVTYDYESSWEPYLVWTGKKYGIAWEKFVDDFNHTEIYFTRLDSAGNKIDFDIRITFDLGLSRVPSLVWTGEKYGIAWTDTRTGSNVYFAKLDEAGNKISSDIRITHFLSGATSLVWTGHEYGISWEDARDDNSEIYFARLDYEGNKIGSDVRVSYNSFSSAFAHIAWTGEQYGITWSDDRDSPSNPYNYEIYFAKIDINGNKIGNDIRVTYSGANARFSHVVWSENEYGIVWNDRRHANIYPKNSEIFFTRMDSLGNKIGSDIRITYSPEREYHPWLVWTGCEYGLSWFDFRDGNTEIYLARLDSSGQKIGSDLRITYALDDSMLPSLAWNGREYAISWMDDRDSGLPEIYFARIGCPVKTNINFNPGTLNLKSKGKWMTCYIELPEEYSVSDIDISTVALSIDGSELIYVESKPTDIGDYDDDGIPELMLKINRSLIQAISPVGENIPFEISGKLYSEEEFSGMAYVRVID